MQIWIFLIISASFVLQELEIHSQNKVINSLF